MYLRYERANEYLLIVNLTKSLEVDQRYFKKLLLYAYQCVVLQKPSPKR